MHRIPKLFTSSHKSKPMESKSQSQPSTPIRKLHRKNAAKNIHYDASTSASTSSEDSLTIRNRSIDRTSFRISGNEGELEFLFDSLGLTGPDELGIDPGDFQAMKARSGDLSGKIGSGEILWFDRSNEDVDVSFGGKLCGGIEVGDDSRSGDLSGKTGSGAGLGLDRSNEDVNVSVGGKLCGGIGVGDDSRVGSVILGFDRSNEGFDVDVSVGGKLCDGIGGLDDLRVRSVVLGVDRSNEYEVVASVDVNDSRVSSVILAVDRSEDYYVNGSVDVKLRDGVLEDGELCSGVVRKVVMTGGRSVGVGIRGERPPAVLLSPPPSMTHPVVDDLCSSGDILKRFRPEDDMVLRIEGENGGASSEDEGERGSQGDGLEGDDDVVRRVRSTNSNDDDSSSTTTDSMSISPNGILRRRISSWAKGRHLGSGSFGSVYEGIADGGFFFAVKEVSLLDQGDKGREIINQFEQEMAFLSQFEHNNIVRYLGTDKDDSNLYIFLELAFGSLLSLYQRFRFQDSHVSVYTRQILEGLKYLHERNVVHRDIKCANILMDVDGNAKLADFGLAKVDKLNDAKSCKGTSYWMAPEVVQPNKRYGCSADIWSLGCTVLEMLTQNFPYHPMNGFQAMFQIGSGLPPPVPNILSRDARDFILKCLQVDPETRPSAAELLEHPFVKKPHSASTSPHHHGMRP